MKQHAQLGCVTDFQVIRLLTLTYSVDYKYSTICRYSDIFFTSLFKAHNYGVESVPKITGLRGPPAFRWSPTFSRPHGFRVLDIPHVNALSVPKIRCLRGSPTFQRSHSFRRPHDLFIFLRLIGCLTYN